MNRRRLLSGYERNIYKRDNLEFKEYSIHSGCNPWFSTHHALEGLLLKLMKYWPKAANEAAKHILDSTEESTNLCLLNEALENGNYEFVSIFMKDMPSIVRENWIYQLSIVCDPPVGKPNYRALRFLVCKCTPTQESVITDVNTLGAFGLLMLVKRKTFVTYDSILSATPHQAQIIRKFWETSLNAPKTELSSGLGNICVFLFHEDTVLLVSLLTTVEEFRRAVARHRDCHIQCVDIFHKGTCINDSTATLRSIYRELVGARILRVRYAWEHPLYCDCGDTKTRDELRRMFPTGTDMTQLDILDAEELRRKFQISQAQHRSTEEIS